MAFNDTTQSWRWGNPSSLHGEVTNQAVEVEEEWVLIQDIDVTVARVDSGNMRADAHEARLYHTDRLLRLPELPHLETLE